MPVSATAEAANIVPGPARHVRTAGTSRSVILTALSALYSRNLRESPLLRLPPELRDITFRLIAAPGRIHVTTPFDGRYDDMEVCVVDKIDNTHYQHFKPEFFPDITPLPRL
ncbi:hypothetical protein E8E11_004898 [Didymella keratinophila]|nr:hypothetical protein E8E11_004898 [Didymella keratinophila]